VFLDDIKLNNDYFPKQINRPVFVAKYAMFFTAQYEINPCSRVLPQNLTDPQPANKLPVLYGTPRFITAFTIAATCPYPEPDKSTPCPPTTSHFLHIDLNIILPYAPRSSKWSLSIRSPHQHHACTSHVPLVSTICLHLTPRATK